jgi:methionine--tRNA ligase beta chain
MNTNRLKQGDYTDKGLVRFVDERSELVPDPLVITDEGTFRESEVTKMEKAPAPEPNPIKDFVDFGAVMSVDIRPGRVSSAVRVKDTDKLLHLQVATVHGTVDVVTNLGSKYAPEDLVGKTFMFVMNMKPVKMRGIESAAMILASSFKKFDAKTNSYIDDVQLLPVQLPLNHVIL